MKFSRSAIGEKIQFLLHHLALKLIPRRSIQVPKSPYGDACS